MSEMMPLLAVALLVWAGIFVFLMTVERRVVMLEKRVREAVREKSK